ncbi:hypothetical protein ACFXKC_14780 [Streptomyces sp. NPDC059340]|uniref:hypothetical protein n=1 Tax=Streptomyces sp. NPDC059340 TaxID=3346806 RepID=UPI0036A6221D
MEFERVLQCALDVVDIRSALRRDPTGRAARRLRDLALEATEEIASAAADEYRDYLAARETRDAREAAEGGLWPVLAVLTPVVAAVAAAVLLLIGYGARLVEVATGFATSVVTAGWVLALTAALTACIGLWALLRTALRQREGQREGTSDGRGEPAGGTDVDRAKERWRQALLERGLLPYLRSHLVADA